MLSAPGLGSGLDIKGIVSQLMELERQPVVALEKRQIEYQTQITAYGQLKASLASFQSSLSKLKESDTFTTFSASSSHGDLLTVSADDTATPGDYQVVVNRLAEQHKLGSAQFAAGDTFGGGAGDSLTLQVGSDPNDTLTIDLSEAKTLDDIRAAIMESPDNPGINATVINANDGRQALVLTSDETGQAGAITATYGGTLDAQTFGFQTLNAGGSDLTQLDAEVVVDGYTITRSDNQIDDVIPGVTLDLKEADGGQSVQVSIRRDLDATVKAVQGFVDAYNQLRSDLSKLGDGDLDGDGTLLLIESRLLGVMNSSSLEGTFRHLSEVGISVQKEGNLTLDSARLRAALEEDTEGVSQLFSAEGKGYASRFDSLVESWLDDDGLLDSRTDGLNSRIDRIEDQQQAMERRLEKVEARYLRQFNAMDSLVTQLNNTGAYLAQQLAAMPGAQS